MERARGLAWLVALYGTIVALGLALACGGGDDDDDAGDDDDAEDDDDDNDAADDTDTDDDTADDDTADDDTADDDTSDDDDTGWYGDEPCEGDMVCFNVRVVDNVGGSVQDATVTLVDGCSYMNPLSDLPGRTEQNVTDETGYTWLTYDCLDGEVALTSVAGGGGFCLGATLEGSCPRAEPLIVNTDIQMP